MTGNGGTCLPRRRIPCSTSTPSKLPPSYISLLHPQRPQSSAGRLSSTPSASLLCGGQRDVHSPTHLPSHPKSKAHKRTTEGHIVFARASCKRNGSQHPHGQQVVKLSMQVASHHHLSARRWVHLRSRVGARRRGGCWSGEPEPCWPLPASTVTRILCCPPACCRTATLPVRLRCPPCLPAYPPHHTHHHHYSHHPPARPSAQL